MSSSAAAAESTGIERERPSWVLGIALGLALFLGCLALLFVIRPRALDPERALADSFQLGTLPDELAFERALSLPGGATVVVLGDGRELGLEPMAELAARVEGGDPAQDDEAAEGDEPGPNDASDAPPKVDWSRVVELERDTPPARVYLVRLPESAAASVLQREFQQLEWKQLVDLGPEGGRVAVESGTLRWGAYAADFVRERRYEPGLAFHDALRVNLARPGRYWIAYAFWPQGHAGSQAAIERVLRAFAPAEADAPPAAE